MNWLIVAFIAPILWALVSLIDNYFVDGVYEDEFDGIVLSAFFQLLPWLLVPFGMLHFFSFGVNMLWAVASGFFFLASLFQYFRSLFRVNDSALMQILWSLSVPLVPFFAFFLVGERLLPLHYLGIAIAFAGVLLFNFDIDSVAARRLRKVALPMTYAVVFMALSMVFGKRAYIYSNDVQTNFLLFCFGGVFILALLPFFDRVSIAKRSLRTWSLLKRYFLIFFLAEGLSVTATFSSQWAIRLSPSVSFVSVVESLTPVFVVLMSLILILFISISGGRHLERIYREQITHMPVKVLATLIILTGVFLIN